MQRSEKMNLTASARLIMQLGEQLIEDELVALLELIKNAYDADANNVDVVIDTDTITPYGVGRIEIKDDGNGMIPSIVRNSFLRLSTSFKEEEKSSIYYHRRVLGKKGIGRLSFQRLGNYITVETVPNIERFEETDLLKDEDVEFIKEYRKINIDIDWSEFPIDMDFSDIIATVKYEKDVVASSGTKIVIQGIKNLNFWDMDKKKEEKLKNELLNMMDPFQKNLNLKKSERFNVLLKINDVPYSAEPIDESLLDELYDSKVSFDFKDWKLHVKIERPLKYVMQRRNSIVNRMKDSGYEILRETQYEKECEDYLVNFKDLNKVYIDYPKIKFTIEKTTFLSESLISKLVEKKEKGEITEEEYRKAIVDQYAYPGDFAGVIYARDKTNKEEIDIILGKEGLVKAKLNTLSDINKAWSSMQGVYVYRNGFRVLPYGRKDWMVSKSMYGKALSKMIEMKKISVEKAFKDLLHINIDNLDDMIIDAYIEGGKITESYELLIDSLIKKNALEQIISSDVLDYEKFLMRYSAKRSKKIMDEIGVSSQKKYDNLRRESNKKKLLNSGTLLYNVADYSINKEYNNPSMGDIYVFTEARSKQRYAGMLISQECSTLIRLDKYPDNIKRKADELLLLLFDIVEIKEESINDYTKKLDNYIWPIKIDEKICLLKNIKRSMYIDPCILDLCGLNASGKAKIQFEEQSLEYKSVYSREFYRNFRQNIEKKIKDTIFRVLQTRGIETIEDAVNNMIISLAYGVEFKEDFELQRICKIDEKQTLHIIHEYLNDIAKIGLNVYPNLQDA